MGILLNICLLLLPAAAAAESPLERAGRQVAARIAPDPAGTEDLFEKEFFRRISLDSLNRTVLGGLYREHGAVKETVLASSGGFSGHFFMDTERGWRIPAAISISPASGKITGLYFSPPYRKDAGLSKVKEALAALPGRAGLLVARLGPGGEPLEALAAGEQFAVGAAANLYLLGAVVRTGTPWDTVYRLSPADKSLPPGGLRDWPDGSPLTVHTLAARMIAESDNTASDALLSALGRRKVEDSLAHLGHSSPGLMAPFPSTSEMFRLKSKTGAALEYINLPPEEKYGFLDSLAAEPLDASRLKTNPFGINKIEWFASPSDLCRLMALFDAGGNREALDILAINPGLPAAGENFSYAGYKGGSGPGVLSAAWLLTDRKSRKFCLSAAWNYEGRGLDEKKFLGLMRTALEALAGAD